MLTVLDAKVAANVHAMHTKEAMSQNALSGQPDTRVTFILFEYAVDSNTSTSHASSSLSSKGSSSAVLGLMKNDSKIASTAPTAPSSNNTKKKSQNFEYDGTTRAPAKTEKGPVKDKGTKKSWLGTQRTLSTEEEVANWLHNKPNTSS